MRIHPYFPYRGQPLQGSAGPLVAGAQLAILLPQASISELLSIHVRLITDATVIDRKMILLLGHITLGPAFITAPFIHTAGLTIDYYFHKGCATAQLIPVVNSWTGPLPVDFPLYANDQVRTLIFNFQPGDQITIANYRFQSWRTAALTP